MQRYFIDDAVISGKVTITNDDARHIGRVMRMKPGDVVVCCGANGRCARCVIEDITPDRVTASVTEQLTESPELPVQVTIAQGLPKGDKLDLVVQKGTELGAFAFLPFQADRSIVRWDEKKQEKKAARLKKIAKEAAEQSERSRIPDVYPSIKFRELIEKGNQYDVKMIAYEEEARSSIKQTLPPLLEQVSAGESVLAVVGPEGGLTEQEVEALKECGFIACGLGPRILRTETAALYLLAAISYHFEG